MRILMLTQWFQPEPQFKGLPLAKALADLGHEVEVLTGFPNYPGGKVYPGYRIRLLQRETMDGISVTRAALYPSHDRSAVRRILNYASFALSSTLLAFTLRRPDVVYVYCPPMTAAAGAMALRLVRNVPYVVDVQDLWPDTLASTGMVNNGVVMRIVGAWSMLAMKYAARLVVLSPGFKTRIEARGISVPVDVIANWAPPEIVASAAELPARTRAEDGRFNVVFAGNMGKAQALGTVLEAARILAAKAAPVHFTMVGGGVDANMLRERSVAMELDNMTFLPQRPASQMSPIFEAADALLVHLRDDPLFAITIPSKTQAYLAVGRPILMGVRGDAAAMVEEAGAGIAFEPEQPETLAVAIERFIAMPADEFRNMGLAGANYYRARLSFEKGVGELAAALQLAAKAR
jgi:colanic acid biosynthesis glycosyl transferase WcaI